MKRQRMRRRRQGLMPRKKKMRSSSMATTLVKLRLRRPSGQRSSLYVKLTALRPGKKPLIELGLMVLLS